MKAADLIKEVRESTQRMWDSHLQYIETNGEVGMLCFTPEVMKKKLERTDRDIINEGIAKGVLIEDAEEYLASL